MSTITTKNDFYGREKITGKLKLPYFSYNDFILHSMKHSI